MVGTILGVAEMKEKRTAMQSLMILEKSITDFKTSTLDMFKEITHKHTHMYGKQEIMKSDIADERKKQTEYLRVKHKIREISKSNQDGK